MRNIDVSAQLNRLHTEFVSRADGEYRIRCPFHDDNNPSCDVSQAQQKFICRSCGVSGTIITLLAKLSGEPKHILLAKLSPSEDKPVEVAVVERFHRRIWTAPTLLEALHKRGVSDDTIRKFRLGETEGRISIPIPNESGIFVNLRKYLPGATDVSKTINLKGRSVPRLYPHSQLSYDKIILCGGEAKALAVLERLNSHGIGSVTSTGGETNWTPAFEDYFADKKVWVCSDIDKAGQQSAEYRCARLFNVAEWVGNLDLAEHLDHKKFPTGDINDYIALNFEDATERLLALLEACPKWISKLTGLVDSTLDPPIETSIRNAMQADMVDKRFKSEVSFTAIHPEAYFIPKDIKPQCNRDQDCCMVCPVYHSPAGKIFTISSESKSIISMVDSHDKVIRDEVREAVGIPTCQTVKLEILARYKVHEMRVQRALNLTQQDSDRTSIPAIVVGQEPELNETYEIVGRSVPHPKSQKCIAIVSETKAIADALTNFTLSEPEELLRFRPKQWTTEAISETLAGIYNEISLNVTRIYERQNLHVAIDLAYHSVLSIKTDTTSQKGRKGWVEVLIVGDSSQGKSETAKGFMDFYGLGDKVDCKNATQAGIIGGLEKEGGGKFYVQWGAIPQNDRRLLFLEELKGMPGDVFAKFTETRSSGVADLPKILRRKAQARTRLVALSNPPKGSMSTYSFGVNAIVDLIRNPEDIRRFDISLILNKEDINPEIINQQRESITPTFTSEQARKLILWCWTRTPEQVFFEPETLAAALSEARSLCTQFSENIPIIDRGDTRNKLLRLAAALAGRTFSASENSQTIFVRPCHVMWVSEFLREQYSSVNHGYYDYSQRAKKQQIILNEKALEAEIVTLPNLNATIEHLLHLDEIEVQDFCNWTGWEKSEAELKIGSFVRNNAVVREGKYYRKTAAFTKILRNMVEKPPEIPAHIVAAREGINY